MALLMTNDDRTLDPDPSARGPRRSVDLTRWEFLRGSQSRGWYRSAPDGSSSVELPHCWNSDDTYQMGRSYYQGYGSYRTTFEAPEHDTGRFYLELGGYYGEADLWLNGSHLGRFDGQYLGVFLPIRSGLREGASNFLAVRMHNRYRRRILPAKKDPDFLLHGGLVGGVRLWCLPSLQLGDRHKRLSWSLIEPAGDRAGAATVTLRLPVTNHRSEAVEVEVVGDLVDDRGRSVATARVAIPRLGASETKEISLTVHVEEPRLWGPRHPYLHTLVVRLHEKGRRVGPSTDSVSFTLGLREALFDERGFFLNGERLSLHGVNRHECLPGFGSALPPDLHRWDAELLAGLGANCVRLAHYPHSPHFLDACDELGLMVLPEVASWKSVATGAWLAGARRQWSAMIERDHHRPSVILWGMGNESRSRKAFTVLRDMVQALDPLARPVTYAENHYYRARRQGTLGIPDVWGLNYELSELERGAAASRLGVVVVTECMNVALHPGEDLPQVRQIGVMEEERRRIDSTPVAAGFFMWAFNDYPTEHRERFRRKVGLFDAWRNPLPAADLFRAWYSQAPMVVLWGDWSEPSAGDTQLLREIHVFSNCDAVDLRQGEEVVARIRGERHSVLSLPWTPAVLHARGRCADGEAEDRMEPWGAAAGFSMRADRGIAGSKGSSVYRVHVQAVDGQGRRNRFYRGSAAVALAGGGRLHCYSESRQVELSLGVGTAFLVREAGEAPSTLDISSPRMRPASLELS